MLLGLVLYAVGVLLIASSFPFAQRKPKLHLSLIVGSLPLIVVGTLLFWK